MARPREFDETTVLEAAMNCFWAQGFEQTSVRDLAEQMGITGASLYNAFGDKRSLYRQAFVHYLAETVRARVARLAKLPPAENYEKAVFPTLEQQGKAKEIITKQWDAVVGANVK